MNDPPLSGRSIEIGLGSQEVITIDLDNLDPNPDDVLELLREGQCGVRVWTRLAAEYWRKGHLVAAERIATVCEQFAPNDFSLGKNIGPMWCLFANLNMAKAWKAPKLILPNAREDLLAGERTKEEYYREAAICLNKLAQDDYDTNKSLAFLTRGLHQLATRAFDDAMTSFQTVLSEQPTNLLALLGKARILYTRRNYSQALQIFQNVLRLSPSCQPDPRIGIGLCLWAMDQKTKAKVAWQRSLELNPQEWSALLLLGLEEINTSKDELKSEAQRAQHFLAGTKLVERAFKLNQKSAAAANALCELFLLKGNTKRAMKLAERTIQFADTITLLTEGYVRAGRAAHAEGATALATKHYSSAIEGHPKHVPAAIGLAQMQMLNDEMAAAIHTLDTLMQSPNAPKSVEATTMLASLRAFPRPGVSSSDLVRERVLARELYDRVTKGIEAEDSKMNGHGPSRLARTVGDDLDMQIEIARLWQSESLDKTIRATKAAIQISSAQGKSDPRLTNNLAVLHHLEEAYADARLLYENALTAAASMGAEAESMSTSILYNLARAYEDLGEESLARDAYEKLLSRHPEYVDAKIRQAQMLAKLNRNNDAHDLLKQALVSQNNNLNVRGFYTYFLIHSNLPKPAKDFVFATLKDHDKHDVYSLCAAGWIHYNQARESRDTSQKGMEERRKNFQRSAEFYEKALQLDPMCAVAAQGLAIVTAEDALGIMSGLFQPASSADEAQRRVKYSREALDIFAKVRESINDGSVYFNMGHCYYARDEFDRAIESYETASTRFYQGKNVPALLCLCRAWYAKGMKDQSYLAMKTAVRYAQQALHLIPNDKAVVYNIAMIQQKSAEMLFSVQPSKRSLKDLQYVIDQAMHAQKIFASLASDTSPMVPYSREIADQRRKYGDNMLKKGEEHLMTQRQYESEVQSKLDSARQKRQEERERLEALERARMEELRIEAEKLAEKRRRDREMAMEWTRDVGLDSDEEKEKKPKKPKKNKTDAGSGDEAEPKKKRRGKLKKGPGAVDAGGDGDEEQAMFTEEDEAERSAKKRPKKRVVRDDEEEEPGPTRKKQYKSKELLSDTDDEMEI